VFSKKPTMAGANASFTSLLLISSLLLASHVSGLEVEYSSLPLVKGLSWKYYDSSCPKLESIIRKHLKKVFTENIGLAAALLRLQFHDCFVQVTNSHTSTHIYT
jgi:peroxidase